MGRAIWQEARLLKAKKAPDPVGGIPDGVRGSSALHGVSSPGVFYTWPNAFPTLSSLFAAQCATNRKKSNGKRSERAWMFPYLIDLNNG